MFESTTSHYAEHDSFQETTQCIDAILENVEKVIHGKRNVMEHILICLLCGGHALLEDVPGVGKTMAVRAFAQTLGLSYKRIQCTPDLLPSDVVGVSIFNAESRKFEFQKGPIFHAMLHVDELNRCSAKTQAAFLEAMEEGQVTVDGITYPLEKPFLILATQNPQDHIGTCGLPEAQLDRFFMKLEMGYPSRASELKLLQQALMNQPFTQLKRVLSKEQLVAIQQQVKQVHIEHELLEMLLHLIELSRNDSRLLLGASPRASLAVLRAAQARALLAGRQYVIPDDVKEMALCVLPHRLLLSAEAQMNHCHPALIVQQLLSTMQIPVMHTRRLKRFV